MEGFFFLLFLIAAGCVLSGPIALIISIISLNKTKEISNQLHKKTITPQGPAEGAEQVKEEAKVEEPRIPKRVLEKEPVIVKKQEQPLQAVAKAPMEDKEKVAAESFQESVAKFKEKQKKSARQKSVSLEQRIGTRWALIAGIIACFVAVAFFLKYAYDNFSIGPLGRVIAVTISGMVALITGEVTRRRGYDIVAKGVTALGFAVLYAAVFSAHRFYGLIGSAPAFVLAILITTAAMSYAVRLDEILIAFLSLLGGFATPVIVSTGENRPMLLFSYVLILSVGAMLCASYRKWRSVNILAFAGTFILYGGWFVKFYRPAIRGELINEPQTAIALCWLTVFFLMYLILPVVFELIKKIDAKKEDVLLILANSFATFYFLYEALYNQHRTGLALGASLLAVSHLSLMVITFKRNPQDLGLRRTLLSIGLVCLTIALPLYLRMHALTLVWAAEAVILAIIGLHYRSLLTEAGGATAFMLSCLNLLIRLPMHTSEFNLMLNPAFGTWFFVAASAYVFHLLYRYTDRLINEQKEIIAQIAYVVMCLILFAAATMEWHQHCNYNLSDSCNYAARGQIVIFAVFLLLFLIRPFCPKGTICDTLSWIAVVSGISFTIAKNIHGLHTRQFTVFLNPDFGANLFFIAAIVIYHLICRQNSKSARDNEGVKAQALFSLAGFTLFIVATMEWYWHCNINLTGQTGLYYISRGQMVIFTITLLLLTLRPLCPRGIFSETASLFLLAIGALFTLCTLPQLHRGNFLIFFNPNFITVFGFLVAILVCHIKYRRDFDSEFEQKSLVSQGIYAVLGCLLLLTVTAEWYWHCRYNLTTANTFSPIYKGQVIIFTAIMMMFSLRPVCPDGFVPRLMSLIFAMLGSLFTVITFGYFYTDRFLIFANTEFAIVSLFVGGLFLAAWLLAKSKSERTYNINLPPLIYLIAVFILWILLTEQIYLYWYCTNKYAQPLANWRFLAHMYISITWAIYAAALTVIGFWRNLPALRYIALGLFAILLAKIFIVDTSEVKNVYRIAAFLATGLTLLGISYLYQFLKKKGFFESILAESITEDDEK